MNPTPADVEALKKLLGQNDNVLSTTQITSSTSPDTVYLVQHRVDTKLGGTYWFCPCPGWKYQRKRGNVCAHAERAQALAECDDCGRDDGTHNYDVEH
jgi:hypothetical protein